MLIFIYYYAWLCVPCREDTTQTGHVLGPAQQLSKQATPERDLSPVACTIIRLIMHATLVWSSVCVKVRTVIFTLDILVVSYIRRVQVSYSM